MAATTDLPAEGGRAATGTPAAARPRTVSGVTSTPVPEVVLAVGATAPPDERPVQTWRIVAQVLAAGAVVLVLVAVAGLVVSRRMAEAEAVNDAAHRTDLLAVSVVQPVLSDDLLAGDPAAVAALDEVVRALVLVDGTVRVKLWAADGTVLYADEPDLVGQVFVLEDDQVQVLRDPATVAEVSELDRAENTLEQDAERLLEVYRPVWTPDGTPLLFETYSRYDVVTARSASLWRGFAGVTITSLLLLVVLLLPVLWALLDRLRRAQEQREHWLHQVVEASDAERRRIAASLHDGVVQDLAGASFAVAGAADRLATAGHGEAAATVGGAASTIRASIQGLRSLLVEIHPPNLRRSGLEAALRDLAGGLGGRGVEIRLDLPDAGLGDLSEEAEGVVYRVAQECLRNAVAHAQASEVHLAVRRDGRSLVLTVVDDGVGFDPAAVLTAPAEGHFGLSLLADHATRAGAALRLGTAPGRGCRWTLTVEDAWT